MYGLSLAKIAKIVQGVPLGGNQSVEPGGASIDTRKLKQGELFFALKGEKVDGHNFLAQAREQGAAGAVVNYRPRDFNDPEFPLIQVENTVKALQQLAVHVRKAFDGPVVGVTGSTGKTTTKDMVASVLAQKGEVLKTAGNYNNELGLPLTILSLEPSHWAMVIEMGMRGLGEIDFLCCISEPTHGIITNIGHTHQELLGTQEKIAQAKAELISHIPAQGGMMLNIDDKEILKPWLTNVRSPLLWYGLDPACHIWGDSMENLGKDGIKFTIHTQEGPGVDVTLPVPGKHNVLNSLAAAGIARQLGLSWQEIKEGLENTRLSHMRLEFINIPEKGIQVINDAYNANPSSMAAALEVLKSAAGNGRAIAVLGDMYELGDYAEEGHLRVGHRANELDVAYLITVGSLGSMIARGAQEAGMNPGKIRTCQNNAEALSYLRDILKAGDVVLIKGSRAVRMEEIVAGILEGQALQ
ncbi:MAG: UDP-N-acetylmuramoylalanyl-D-glutamyl-2,6-diaminopimelate/D-alanyl-D-alanyl ligase [Peptococcaceae bacterium]|jgi:UDP-N-acetylmuramoyl-tripeptide--D-alanyl-D-alanine ligase|nr:UDP-N-acetylmuramoylalanyl-D-glutamyl-2,6-diaminopimelate/D-alanyl-D-alanyl ligase [Peptococcaceae bacterium]